MHTLVACDGVHALHHKVLLRLPEPWKKPVSNLLAAPTTAGLTMLLPTMELSRAARVWSGGTDTL